MTGPAADPDPLAGLDLGFLGLLGCTGAGCRGRKSGGEPTGLITPRGAYNCGPETAISPLGRGIHSVGFPNGMPSPTKSSRSPARVLAKAASGGSLEGAKQALMDTRAELDVQKKKREYLELQRQVRSCAG